MKMGIGYYLKMLTMPLFLPKRTIPLFLPKSTSKECEKCVKWEKDYVEAISHIADLEDELQEWNLESLLEKIQMAMVRKQDISEEDKKRLNYIKDLVDVMYKYIELKENMLNE